MLASSTQQVLDRQLHWETVSQDSMKTCRNFPNPWEDRDQVQEAQRILIDLTMKDPLGRRLRNSVLVFSSQGLRGQPGLHKFMSQTTKDPIQGLSYSICQKYKTGLEFQLCGRLKLEDSKFRVFLGHLVTKQNIQKVLDSVVAWFVKGLTPSTVKQGKYKIKLEKQATVADFCTNSTFSLFLLFNRAFPCSPGQP